MSADTNKDDLECPIHLKVYLADGTLDVVPCISPVSQISQLISNT